ncbi:MAG TPA: class I SAM-dependent methyltransferase [Ktedonobacterales bacterium]|jgi:ubiquinone/menaquinone biosynthesis C-methylase UbiE
MQQADWRELAEWYDARQGDVGDLWHRTMLDPPLFEQIGAVAELRVLDLACGNGHNTRRLARLGARVTGVDWSAALIARNQAREEAEPLGIAYHAADATRLDMLADAAFDLVVCQMALMDIPDASAAILETARVLVPGGRFVALLIHPCFDVPGASGWVVERMGPETTVWRKVSRYREPFEGRIHMRVEGEIVYVPTYHRPLSWYVRALGAAGLALTALEEPTPTAEFLAERPDGTWMMQVPLHCLIEARKLSV